MNILNNLGCIAYIVIGIILAYYWWKLYYEEDYNKAKEDGEVEDPMAILILLIMTIFWPIKIIFELIKYIYLKILNITSSYNKSL